MNWVIAIAVLQSVGYDVTEQPMPYETSRRLVVSYESVFSTITLPIVDGMVEACKVSVLIRDMQRWRDGLRWVSKTSNKCDPYGPRPGLMKMEK